jgi:hypothetical protein
VKLVYGRYNNAKRASSATKPTGRLIACITPGCFRDKARWLAAIWIKCCPHVGEVRRQAEETATMIRQPVEDVLRSVQHWAAFEQELTRGQKYRVVQPFRDADNDEHHSGEEWFFVSSSYSHYHGIQHVFVLDDKGEYWQMAFRDNDPTAETFKEYVRRVPDQFRSDLFATSRCIDCLKPLDATSVGKCPHCGLIWTPA